MCVTETPEIYNFVDNNKEKIINELNKIPRENTDVWLNLPSTQKSKGEFQILHDKTDFIKIQVTFLPNSIFDHVLCHIFKDGNLLAIKTNLVRNFVQKMFLEHQRQNTVVDILK